MKPNPICQPGDTVVLVTKWPNSPETRQRHTVQAAPFGRIKVDGTTFHKSGHIAMTVMERLKLGIPQMWLEKI